MVESAESGEELRDALVHLPQHYRSVIVLHDAERWPASQVAAVLGISLPAAKQRLRRGRMILVSALAHGRERRAANSSVPLSCWAAREQVSGYLDGDLDASARAALEVHLATPTRAWKSGGQVLQLSRLNLQDAYARTLPAHRRQRKLRTAKRRRKGAER